METITASVPVTQPPSWAAQQQLLMSAMEQCTYPYWDKYCRDDGELIWDDAWGGGSPDDFYEAFFNWPLLYILGGGEDLLERAHLGWEGVTRILTRTGNVHKEYAVDEDQFHQAESDIFFYHLSLADPGNAVTAMRARRFAGLYMNEDPEAINYDPIHKIILSPRTGSRGPHYFPDDAKPGPVRSSERYGLPAYDLPGIESWKDTLDDEKALRLGEAMHKRWQKGDVAANLAVTSLITNTFLLTGEEKYRDWVLEYTDAWMDRARKNDWLLPDNVGHSGEVGEYIDGKWYGGMYGWTQFHGWYNLQATATNVAANAYLLTRDDRYLELPRRQMDRIIELGETRDISKQTISLEEHWIGQRTAMGDRRETFLVPYRYGDAGWFDWQPLSPTYLAALWNLSQADEDWERIERVRQAEAYDWNDVICFHNKEDGGHEQPWLRYLAGDNPDYPERSLQASYQEMSRRVALVREENEVGTHINIHRWQEVNPVSSETLIQQTLGAPQPIYNGGLLHCRLRYYDTGADRPGLPADVAALVEKLEAKRTVVRLVNLNPVDDRELVIQAGAYGEHSFGNLEYSALTSEFPGKTSAYTADPVTTESRTATAGGRHLRVYLPAGTEICLDLATDRYVNEPSCQGLL